MRAQYSLSSSLGHYYDGALQLMHCGKFVELLHGDDGFCR